LLGHSLTRKHWQLVVQLFGSFGFFSLKVCIFVYLVQTLLGLLPISPVIAAATHIDNFLCACSSFFFLNILGFNGDSYNAIACVIVTTASSHL